MEHEQAGQCCGHTGEPTAAGHHQMLTSGASTSSEASSQHDGQCKCIDDKWVCPKKVVSFDLLLDTKIGDTSIFLKADIFVCNLLLLGKKKSKSPIDWGSPYRDLLQQ